MGLVCVHPPCTPLLHSPTPRPSTLRSIVRLETLEGVVAYHSQELPRAQASLKAAAQKLAQLEVPDEKLAQLHEMGEQCLHWAPQVQVWEHVR